MTSDSQPPTYPRGLGLRYRAGDRTVSLVRGSSSTRVLSQEHSRIFSMKLNDWQSFSIFVPPS